MKAVIQRVKRASVTIDGKVKSQIGKGLLILLGIHENDTEDDAVYLAKKCSGMRIFEDENGKMNLAPADVGAEFLIISNFTLYGDCKKGYRPSFTAAARPEKAVPLYEKFIELMRESSLICRTGEFGADMAVELINDGPITIVLESGDAK